MDTIKDTKSSIGQKGYSNGQSIGQENVWLDFITDNKDFLVSFRTRVRKIASALYMLGNLWQEDDFGKHLQSVSLSILSASKIPVTDNKEFIMHHFMSVKESVEYALSLIIFGAEAGLLATSNVVMITPFCVALLGDLHDLENTLPSLFNTKSAKRTLRAPDISEDITSLFEKDHTTSFFAASPLKDKVTLTVPTQAQDQNEIEEDKKAAKKQTEAPQQSDTPKKVVSKKEAPTPVQTKRVRTNDEREAIYASFVRETTRTPSDLYEEFPNLSTKRIQRELQSLAEEGRITKEGNKRWVMYHLAK